MNKIIKRIILTIIILIIVIIGTWRITMLTLQVDNTNKGVYITSFGQTDAYN